VALLLVANLGPSIERWRLTGEHRVVPLKSDEEMIQAG
jgi:hypothetical protein